MVAIRHLLVDVTLTYREHVIELPSECASCGDPLLGEDGCVLEENWSTSHFRAAVDDGAVVVSGDEERADGDYFPSVLFCRCGHEFARGDLTVLG